jgi:hypothetical protein
MKTKFVSALTAVLLLAVSAVSAYQVELPESIKVFQNVPVLVVPEPGDPAPSAVRFYVYPPGEDEPLFLDLSESPSGWKGLVPGQYSAGSVFEYAVEVLSTSGIVIPVPQEGTFTIYTEEDSDPPELTLILPEEGVMVYNEPQVVLIRADDTSAMQLEQLLINGEELEGAELVGSTVKGIYTPKSSDSLNLSVAVTDALGNRGEGSFPLTVVGEPGFRFFTAGYEYHAGANVTYTLSSEQEGLEIPGELFSGLSHEVLVDASAGVRGYVAAGPVLEISASADLAESRNLFDYLDFDAYPTLMDYPFLSGLASDFHDIMRLWNPYAFNYTSGYGDAEGRAYDTGNEYLLEVSFLFDILTYRFGDQTIYFQDQTVKDLYLRGSSVTLDLPLLLSLQVANGFTDPGIYGEAWPRAFVGFQLGLDVFDYWYFQTNLSLISDYQGSYDDIITLGTSPIGSKFGLVDEDDNYTVKPVENLVLGLGTGFNLPWFELKAEGALTLYANDAGTVVDVVGLLEGFIDDQDTLDSIEGSIDMVQGYFPVIDYFPISLGIAAPILDGTLWGVNYGAGLTIPALGLEGWYRKTDGSFKSLGASVTSGKMETGGRWKLSIGSWGLEVGYSWNKTNIPNILIEEILPLVSSFIPDTVSDIIDQIKFSSSTPEIAHSAVVKVQSPNLGAFGRFSTEVSGVWEKMDTEVTASDYDEAYVIGADAGWKSKNFKFGKFSMNYDAKAGTDYEIPVKIGGADPTVPAFWSFSAGGGGKIGYDIISLSASYVRDWGTAEAVDMADTIKGSISLKNLWFDTIKIGGTWKEKADYQGIWEERTVSADLSLKKTLGITNLGVDLKAGFTDALDNSDDESSWSVKVYGGVSL